MKNIFAVLFVAFGIATAIAQQTDTNPRQLTSIAFASLGTPGNGALVYCSDCTAANPCAGSGTGAVARRENSAWNCGGGTGGGTTIPTGASDFLYGLPTNTATNSLTPAGGANGGMVLPVTMPFNVIKKINFNVAVAGSAGTGIIFGIFAAPAAANGALGSALCVAVASGTDATTTGTKSIAWASGSNVSTGVCTLTAAVAGGGYRLAISSDSTTLTLTTYNFALMSFVNVNDTTRGGYANSVSTGTGSGLAFATLGASFFTTLPSGSNSYFPVLVWEN